MIKEGDIVTRKSYGNDLNFKVEGVADGVASLSCISHRLAADAPVEDLVRVKKENLSVFKKFFRDKADKKTEELMKEIKDKKKDGGGKGKILHIDSDPGYLDMCMSYYEILGVPAEGRLMHESDMAEEVEEALGETFPDILILTGHDALRKNSDINDMSSYVNSEYYVRAVKAARFFQSYKDALFIFAGACQSYYEAIIGAGANFASSPERTLIHALDPVFIGARVAYTPLGEIVSPEEVVRGSVSEKKGIGGYEARGVLRIGEP